MKIVQCWDDGVTSDISLIDILRKYQARASFNLNGSLHHKQRGGLWKYRETSVIRLSLGELRDVYQGFIIANHTSTHPHLEELTLSGMKSEIGNSRKFLQDHFSQKIEGFAYPFGTWDNRVVDVLKSAGHLYGRTTKNTLWIEPPEQPLLLPTACHFLDANFWDLYEASKERGVFYFWGHSYEIIGKKMLKDFDDTIGRINDDPESEWEDLPRLFTS